MVRPGVGYIAMTGGFNTTTADEFAGRTSESSFKRHEHPCPGSGAAIAAVFASRQYALPTRFFSAGS
mgnify:CR=1 FL=1